MTGFNSCLTVPRSWREKHRESRGELNQRYKVEKQPILKHSPLGFHELYVAPSIHKARASRNSAIIHVRVLRITKFEDDDVRDELYLSTAIKKSVLWLPANRSFNFEEPSRMAHSLK